MPSTRLSIRVNRAPSSASLLQYASLRGSYALLNSALPALPCAMRSHIPAGPFLMLPLAIPTLISADPYRTQRLGGSRRAAPLVSCKDLTSGCQHSLQYREHGRRSESRCMRVLFPLVTNLVPRGSCQACRSCMEYCQKH